MKMGLEKDINTKLEAVAVLLVLTLILVQTLQSIRIESPTFDEPHAIIGGYSYLKTGKFTAANQMSLSAVYGIPLLFLGITLPTNHRSYLETDYGTFSQITLYHYNLPKVNSATFLTTFNVMGCMKNNGVREIVFASSSAIYGDLNKTLYEDIGPLFPTSFYGAAKLSSEAFISAFSANYNIKAWIFRFPNVVGDRLTHGVVYDFINKLRGNPKELTILGNGRQSKSYMYVEELIEGIVFGWKNSGDNLNYFNLGVDSFTTVTEIAEIVVGEMGLKNVKFRYTGGERGWVGDVPSYKFELSKIHKLGWKAKLSSDEAVRRAVRKMLGKD